MITVFKFRLWDKDKKSFVEPFYTKFYDDDNNGIFFGSEDRPKYISQFTGFKDKNGRDIYEDDIISDGKVSVKVECYKGCFGAKFTNEAYCNKKKIYCNHFYPFYFSDAFAERAYTIINFTVIGNIFQNPELVING